MKQEEQTYWQIHDFLKGKLKGEELQEFQKQLTEDATLQKEVTKHKMANQLVIQNRLQVAKQVSLETQALYKKEILYKKIGITCVIALIAGTLLFFGLQATENTSIKVNTPKSALSNSAEIETIKKIGTHIQKESKAISTNETKVKGPISTGVQISVSQPVERPQPTENEATLEKIKIFEETSISPRIVKETPILPALPKKEEVKAEKTCADIKIEANISVTNACQGDNNGSITASRFEGGVSPYRYEVQSHASSQVFSHSALPLGSYVVLITDAHHCTAKIDNVVVKGVFCEEEEKAFNPFLDELLELPSYSSGGTFVVHEKNGNVFYKKEIVKGEKIEWNGMSSQGQLEAGHFSYEVQYHDGTRKQGGITITR